jgi:uncharacterized protein (TIGR03435 family)
MTRLRPLDVAALAICVNSALMAQAPSFEVASIKVNKIGNEQSGPQNPQPGGRLTLTNRTLRFLVQFAYSPFESPLHDFQIVGGPDWVDRDRFDVTAKMPGDPVPSPETANLARLMLRTLLAERFQLRVRKESREFPVYSLQLHRPDGRLGPGLRRRPDSCEGGVRPRRPEFKEPDLKGTVPLCGLLKGGRGALNFRGVSISSLLRPSALGGLDRIVIDQTRLEGNFDIDLTWSPPTATQPSDAPSIFTAVQEQLGLKLVSARAPLDVLVIEGAQRLSPD